MQLEVALRDVAAALNTEGRGRRGDARLRAARRVVVDHCAGALAISTPAHPSIAAIARLAAEAPNQPARRACALLLVHALATPGLVPAASAGDVCLLIERGLRSALLRVSYSFGAPLDERFQVLSRLHASIDQLMQPMEPTFPSWIQGLHAG